MDSTVRQRPSPRGEDARGFRELTVKNEGNLQVGRGSVSQGAFRYFTGLIDEVAVVSPLERGAKSGST